MTHALWFLNTRVDVRRSSHEGPDRVCVLEHTLPFGDSPPTHRHDNEDEIFHLVSGAIRFRIGDRTVELRPGETTVGPKGVPHAFTVTSPEGARMITVTIGHDFEDMIREVARPAETAGLPPAMTPSPAMQAALAEATLRHDIELVGPPLG